MASKYRRAHPSKWIGVYVYDLNDSFNGKPNVCYHINYRLDGKLVWEKIGKASEGYTPEVASELRADRLRAARHGKTVKTAKEIRRENADKNRPLSELADTYFTSKERTLKGIVTDKNRYEKHIKPFFAAKTVPDISATDVESLKARMAHHKPATVWNTLELLRRIINHGHKLNLCPAMDFRVEMPRKDNEVVEFLSPEEAGRLARTLSDWPARDVAHMLELAFVTGMRRGEIFKLEDQDLDFVMGRIIIRKPKGGKTTSVPMNSAAESILKRQLAWRKAQCPDSTHIFPGKDGGQRVDCSAVDRIRKAAALPADFRLFHGLRHHYAVTLANSGHFTLDMIAELLTHKDTAMTKRYGQFLPETLKRASELASALLLDNAQG
ncbi:MAG: tyrosine-type recombinase/integrase [Desulfovibrionaceae bacterium]